MKIEAIVFFATLVIQRVSLETFAPFVNTGKIFQVKAVVDLVIEFDFSRIRESCDAALFSVKASRQSSRHKTNPQFMFLLNRLATDVQTLCDDPIFSLSPHDLTQSHVEKRQAVLGGIAIGALASYVTNQLFASSSHSMKVEKHNFHTLDKEMRNMQKFVSALVIKIEQHQSVVDAQMRLLQLQAVLQSTRQHVKSASDEFVRLLQGQLSHDILSTQAAKQQLASLRTLAASQSAHLPFEDVFSLFVFPVHHTMHGSHVSFSVSVPLVSAKYTNWRFLQAPMVIEHNNEHTFVTPNPRKHFLAAPENGESVVLSESDLAHCTSWYRDFFCTYLPNRRKDDTCLVSLFHEPADVLKVCDFFVPYFPDYVLTHLNEKQFLLSLNISSLSYEEKCSSGNSTFGTFLRGQRLIELPEGCSLSTKLFDVPAYTSVQRAVRVRPFAPVLHNSFFKGNISALAPEFTLLQHEALQEFENENPLEHWPLFVVTIVIMFVIMCMSFVMLRCIYRNRVRKPNP